MQSAVPAVPIKLINQALLMARATSAWHEVCGKGCWGAAEGALVGGRPPCGASSRPADAEGEPCLGSRSEGHSRACSRTWCQCLMSQSLFPALAISGWRKIHLGDGRAALMGTWRGYMAGCCAISHGGGHGGGWWSA